MAKESKDDRQKEKPKIVVDDDWKAQAQADKEKLAKETEKPGAAAAPGEGGRAREIPPASFVTLVNSLALQTMLALGGLQDRRTKKVVVDMELAKHHIDTLVVLDEKTKGNLNEEEKAALDRALYETRMAYVDLAQRIAGGGR